jgi:hypothetical protein
MKRFLLITCSALAFLALAARVPAQTTEPAHGDSPKADLNLTEPLLVGTTTLQPGEYRYQCKHIDGKNFLVITAAENGKEMARVPCRPETLKGKVNTSDYRSVVKDGKRMLTSVRLKGETVAHVVITD